MPVRKSQQELDDLLDAVIDQLAARGLQATCATVGVTQLAKRLGYARQTVHTHLGSRAKAVATAAWHLSDLEATTVRETLDQIMAMHRSAPAADSRALFEQLLAFNFTEQLRKRASLAGWTLHVAALAYSEVWDGPPPSTDRALAAAATEILAARAALYEAMGNAFAPLVQMACRAAGRAPADDTDVDEIVLLLNALFDGLVLRAALHPDRVTPELVGRAIYRLAEAVTVEGARVVDPQRPADPASAAMFDRIVAQAVMSYRTVSPPDRVELVTVFEAAGCDAAVAHTLFPHEAALLDSAARRILPVEELAAAKGHLYPLDMLGMALRTLSDAADDNAALLAATRASTTLLDEVTHVVVEILDGAAGRRPTSTAAALVRFACEGHRGRDALGALLEALALESPAGAAATGR